VTDIKLCEVVPLQQYRCKSIKDPDDVWTDWTDRYSEEGYDFCTFATNLIYQFREIEREVEDDV